MDKEGTQAEEDGNPLVTMILFSYNQEEYIEEAVESALSQNYQNLEIIISDDCSSDGTYSVIEKLAASYSGPHSLQINRNSENQGIGRHVSNGFEMAKGDLIVLGAGDDVSRADRVEVLVNAWTESGRPAGIASAVTMIDSNGLETGTREGFCGVGGVDVGEGKRKASLDAYVRSSGFSLLGCSAAWSREVIEVFGRLADDVMNEDAAFSLRALMIGDVLSVSSKLVKYRVHGGNVWTTVGGMRFKTVAERRVYEEGELKKAAYRGGLCRLGLADLEVGLSKKLVTPEQFEVLTESLRSKGQQAQVAEQWWTFSFIKRITHFTKLKGGFGTKVLKLLPFEVFLKIKSAF